MLCGSRMRAGSARIRLGRGRGKWVRGSRVEGERSEEEKSATSVREKLGRVALVLEDAGPLDLVDLSSKNGGIGPDGRGGGCGD